TILFHIDHTWFCEFDRDRAGTELRGLIYGPVAVDSEFVIKSAFVRRDLAAKHVRVGQVHRYVQLSLSYGSDLDVARHAFEFAGEVVSKRTGDLGGRDTRSACLRVYAYCKDDHREQEQCRSLNE